METHATLVVPPEFPALLAQGTFHHVSVRRALKVYVTPTVDVHLAGFTLRAAVPVL